MASASYGTGSPKEKTAMPDDIYRRAANMRDAAAEYCAVSGIRMVIYMLPPDAPLPAPQINDTSFTGDDCIVILPDDKLDKTTETC